LDGVEVLAQVEERELGGLNACIFDPASERDLLVFEFRGLGKVGAWCACGLEVGRSAEWQLAI
jgi:hypothetical protein